MVPETFKTLVDQVKGRTIAMSLYNLGEPLVNKALPSMIRYAEDANINTYITTNFSMPLSDERLKELAASGLSLLIVAVDGISDETYGEKRRKGSWSLIDDNLRRFSKMRSPGSTRMTLQYLIFDHNRHEADLVRGYCNEVGIDDLLIFEGAHTPWLKQYAPRKGWHPRKRKSLPRCGWPFFSSLVGTDGNVYGCCHYRMDENYLRRAERKPLGNIHLDDMKAIYSGNLYRAARRMVVDPASNRQKDEHFCSGCPVIQSDPVPGNI
jgi:MoaA/NifB/PqqE/SkfB family radical SAM enzyme